MSHVTDPAAPRPKYWTSVADRDGDPTVRELQEREFRSPADGTTEAPTRRDFLKFLGAGAAFAAAGCARKPVEKILPYLKAPEDMSPGNAVYYASTCGECSSACGVLVKTREGRPIKLEGNPDHPLTRGALCARGQASVLNLYDPDRLKGPVMVQRSNGAASATSWSAVDQRTVQALQQATAQGKAVVLLTGTITSPSTVALAGDFLKAFPSAEHVVYDAISYDALARAQELSYGARLVPGFDLDKADFILSIGADFLGTWLSPVEFGRAFSRRRRPESGVMSRLVTIEPSMSLTGTNADQRLRVRPDDLFPVAMALAHELLVREPRGSLAGDASAATALRPFAADGVESAAGLPPGTLASLANELWEARGRSLVLAGTQVAPAAHAVPLQVAVNLLNSALGNEGVTVNAASDSKQAQGSEEAVTRLLDRMRAGDVGALLIQGANPAYSLPGAAQFADALKRVPFALSFADRVDETAHLCDVVAPETNPLESWNDHEPRRGVRSLAQPSIAPLVDARSFQDSLLAWARLGAKGPLAATTGTWHDWLRDRWRTDVYPAADAAASFDLFWEGALRAGVVKLAAPSASARAFRSSSLIGMPSPAPSRAANALTLVLYASTAVHDGASGNNAWMQEVPDPVTKVVWDNVALMAPSRAKQLGLTGVTESVLASEVVTIDAGYAKLDLPVFIQPGLHPDVIAVAVGYGRTAAGRVGNGVGQNAYALAQVTGGRIGVAGIPVKVTNTGRRARVAMVQGHQSTENRPIIFESTFAEFQKDPGAGNESHGNLPSMWTRHKYPGHKWGMAVDLTACIGCSACMVACRSENNIPVVGKKVVLQGREMDWIRIDRYYSGDAENPDTVHQPMLCQHCENAPCETVCPVLATTHSSEGLNMQTYNRCVGTRYCSNNCPYKVRRFNWFEYTHVPASLRLVLNPDVTVRTRGIMEKCTMCVQRIRDGKEKAKALGIPVKDGDIQTACMQTCPTDAIVFGDLNDPNSRAAKLSKNERGYHVLEELNTLPSITYQTKIRNREEATA